MEVYHVVTPLTLLLNEDHHQLLHMTAFRFFAPYLTSPPSHSPTPNTPCSCPFQEEMTRFSLRSVIAMFPSSSPE